VLKLPHHELLAFLSTLRFPTQPFLLFSRTNPQAPSKLRAKPKYLFLKPQLLIIYSTITYLRLRASNMALQVSLMTPADIDGAIDTIQQAFAEDPYNKWIYNDRSKVRPLAKTNHPTI
jgi:hypothetical protein